MEDGIGVMVTWEELVDLDHRAGAGSEERSGSAFCCSLRIAVRIGDGDAPMMADMEPPRQLRLSPVMCVTIVENETSTRRSTHRKDVSRVGGDEQHVESVGFAVACLELVHAPLGHHQPEAVDIEDV
eukprot:1167488-Rhodomonas_salina.2